MGYTLWRITTLPNGKATLHYETDDDNDDGYSGDNDFGSFDKVTTLENALKVAGTSHTGYFGQSVEVYLDGKKI